MAATMDMDQDVKPGTASILNWYDSTRPMFIDLVGDYAGKELFLIEGDSLLRETFEDERIDFRGKSPSPLFLY
jgi:ATP-dependent RNA helicase DDX60